MTIKKNDSIEPSAPNAAYDNRATTKASVYDHTTTNDVPIVPATIVSSDEPDIVYSTAETTSQSIPTSTIPTTSGSATPITSTSQPAKTVTTTTTIVQPPPRQQSTTIPVTSHPPPGVPDGGIWTKIRHHGPATWLTCGILSVVGCAVLLFPCGVFALCCPCDEKDAYKVNGKLYDHNGRYIRRAKGRE